MNTLRILAAMLLPLAIGTASPALALPIGDDAGGINLSGQYTGTVSDSVLGAGTAVANFVGGGRAVGGWFGFTFGSNTYDNPALAGGTREGIAGEFEAMVGSVECRFQFRATLDRGKYSLQGKYRSVVSSCDGEHGTFDLTQQCYYKLDGGLDGDVRRNGGPMHC
jgi:hypothetical protein